MVGGEKALLDRCHEVLAASGDDVVHVGPLGAGVKTKLAHQVICIGTLNAVAEGMLLAETAGVDMQAFGEVLRQGSARSHFTDTWVSGRFRDRTPEQSAVMRDSVDPALELARELGVRLPLAALAQQLFPFWWGKRSQSGSTNEG
jgi:2-hydroxy-3-oxopropionate reductase